MGVMKGIGGYGIRIGIGSKCESRSVVVGMCIIGVVVVDGMGWMCGVGRLGR